MVQRKFGSTAAFDMVTYSPPLVDGSPHKSDEIALLNSDPPFLLPGAWLAPKLLPCPPPFPPEPDPKPPLPLLPLAEDVVDVEAPAVYETSKLVSEMRVTSVKTSLLVFSISMTVASVTPSEDDEVEAAQSVNVMFPKSAKEIKESFSSKSSTIHSAFSPPRAEVEVKDLVAVLPVVRFSMVAEPEVVVVAFTYIKTTCGGLDSWQGVILEEY